MTFVSGLEQIAQGAAEGIQAWTDVAEMQSWPADAVAAAERPYGAGTPAAKQDAIFDMRPFCQVIHMEFALDELANGLERHHRDLNHRACAMRRRAPHE